MMFLFIAAAFFLIGLGLVVMFRSTVSADDDLERRWMETVHASRMREAKEEAERDAETADASDSGEDPAKADARPPEPDGAS